MRSAIRLALLAMGFALPFGAPTADAQRNEADTFDRTPIKCVSIARIRRMEPVDDRTILFFMRGDRVLRNTLREECRDLQYSKDIRYSINAGRLSQVCDGHPITIVERNALCALGAFSPITEDEARALAATDKR